MIYFAHSLKLILRSKGNLIVMLLLPSLLIGAIFGLSDWGNSAITVGLVDLDRTRLTEMLAADIEATSPLIYLEEDEIRGTLANSRADYIIVVEDGFTEALVTGKEALLHGYSIQESNMAMPARMKIDAFLTAAKNIAAAADGNRDTFYEKLEDYQNGRFTLQSTMVGLDNQDASASLGGIGLLAMSMMFLAMSATTNLLKDKEDRTFYRVMASPLSLKSYMFQNILSFYLVSLLQVAGVFVVILYVFKISLGASVLNLFIVMAVFSFLCVSMGVAMAGLARNTRQAGAVTSLVVIPMSMLGGLFWPSDMMPDLLQRIGNLLPTSWTMDAAHKVILGSSIAEVRMEILIVLMYSLVFFLLGSWRKTDIAR